MIVNLYSFGKAKNSTKRPAGAGTAISGNIIGPSSLFSPTISFANPTARSNNYAYIAEYDRYYFVLDWTYDKGFWIASMSEDVLASWKGTIGGSTQYVLRSSASYDGSIIDNLYPIKAENEMISVGGVLSGRLATRFSEGFYVVGIIGGGVSPTGCVAYYVFTPNNFNNFCNYLMGRGGSVYPVGWTDEQKSRFNPMQYIVSVNWIPKPPDSLGQTFTEIPFGWWTVAGISCVGIGENCIMSYTATFNIPRHPQATQSGSYKNIAPYSRYALEFLPFGVFDIDSTRIADVQTLKVLVAVDCITGLGQMRVLTTDSVVDTILFSETQYAVPIQISQITRDYLALGSAVVGSGISAITNATTGNGAGFASAIANGITSAASAMIPTLNTKGAVGSIITLLSKPYLRGIFNYVVDEDNQHMGRPLCKNVQLSTIPGYMIINDPNVEFAGNSNEQESIQKFMEEGFYFE